MPSVLSVLYVFHRKDERLEIQFSAWCVALLLGVVLYKIDLAGLHFFVAEVFIFGFNYPAEESLAKFWSSVPDWLPCKLFFLKYSSVFKMKKYHGMLLLHVEIR